MIVTVHNIFVAQNIYTHLCAQVSEQSSAVNDALDQDTDVVSLCFAGSSSTYFLDFTLTHALQRITATYQPRGRQRVFDRRSDGGMERNYTNWTKGRDVDNPEISRGISTPSVVALNSG